MVNGGHDPELDLGRNDIEEAVQAVCELGRKIDWDWRHALPGEQVSSVSDSEVPMPGGKLLPRTGGKQA